MKNDIMKTDARNHAMSVFLILAFALLFSFSSINVSLASDVEIQTGFQYDWWEDNKDNRANQAYIPVRIDVNRKNYSLSLLTGYANTHVELAGKENRTLSNMLDSKINFSYGISKGLPFQALIGLDLNLPTGKTDFRQEELVLIMDPDLVPITSFGEGYNINPTLSIAREWEDIAAGIGIGYLWRGEYDFSGEVKDYDPGDILNTSAEVRYSFSPDLSGRIFGNYVMYGKDRVGGEDFYQEGDYYRMGLGINYSGAGWDTGLTVRGILRDKGKTQDARGGLSTENNKIRGDEWNGDLALRYRLDDKTTLKTFVESLYISENGYSRESTRFVGRREKFTLGLGAARILASHLEGAVTLKGFVMHDAEANFPEARSAGSYKGFSFVVKVFSRFKGI